MKIYAALALLILFGSDARSHDAHEHPELTGWAEEQIVTPEYGKRMGCAEPSNATLPTGRRNNSCYCCDKSEVLDGKDTEFHLSKDRTDERGYALDEWWYKPKDGEWKRIPDDTIHWDEHSPTGEPILFMFDGKERCFFPAEWKQ